MQGQKQGRTPLQPEEVAGQESEVETNDADLTDDKNLFILSFLCCNDSDDAKATFQSAAKQAVQNKWYRVSGTE